MGALAIAGDTSLPQLWLSGNLASWELGAACRTIGPFISLDKVCVCCYNMPCVCVCVLP